MPWILTLLLAAGQGVTILVLSTMLWRRRVHRAQCRGESLPPRGRKAAHGCEAEGRPLILPLYPVFSRAGGGREYSSELPGDVSAVPHMALSPQMPRFLSSNLKSRSMKISIWPDSGEEQLEDRGLHPKEDWGQVGLGLWFLRAWRMVVSLTCLSVSQNPQPTCPQDQMVSMTSAGK